MPAGIDCTNVMQANRFVKASGVRQQLKVKYHPRIDTTFPLLHSLRFVCDGERKGRQLLRGQGQAGGGGSGVRGGRVSLRRGEESAASGWVGEVGEVS